MRTSFSCFLFQMSVEKKFSYFFKHIYSLLTKIQACTEISTFIILVKYSKTLVKRSYHKFQCIYNVINLLNRFTSREHSRHTSHWIKSLFKHSSFFRFNNFCWTTIFFKLLCIVSHE